MTLFTCVQCGEEIDYDEDPSEIIDCECGSYMICSEED